MTSKEFTAGLGNSRSSSKVLKPPGGDCSDIFGLGRPSVDNKEGFTKNRLFGSDNSNVRNTPQRNASNIFRGEPQTPVSSKKQYVRRNPITGEGCESPDQEKPSSNEDEIDQKGNKAVHNESDDPSKTIQTSVRVRHPPGGKSSGIF